MSNETCITLYDFASKTGEPWNPVPLRIRYVLNFKGIPFKTVWLEYPNVETTLKSIGALPTGVKPDGKPFYTLPVIVDPTHPTPGGGPTVVADSWAITEYLDNTYPGPSVLLPKGTKALQKLFEDHFVQKAFYTGAPIWISRFFNLLNEESRPYVRQTREAYFGQKIEALCPKGTPKWDETWDQVQKGLSGVAAILDKNGSDGKDILVMGNNVTFADFVIASCLETILLVTPDEWEARVSKWDGGRWERIRNHCARWK